MATQVKNLSLQDLSTTAAAPAGLEPRYLTLGCAGTRGNDAGPAARWSRAVICAAIAARTAIRMAETLPEEYLRRTAPWLPGNATVAERVEAALNRVVASAVRVPRPAEVRGYLSRYPDILLGMERICTVAAGAFGATAQLSLELYRDAEFDHQHLTLYVRQDAYEDSLLEMLDQLMLAHEADLVGRSGWFLVTTDFQPPR